MMTMYTMYGIMKLRKSKRNKREKETKETRETGETREKRKKRKNKGDFIMRKRVLCLIMCLSLLICGVVPSAFADDIQTGNAEPAAKTLTYDGTQQELVTKGSASTGKIQYKLGENGSWQDNVPMAKNAGSYDVYYKTVNTTQGETQPQKVTVTINKKDIGYIPVCKPKIYNGKTDAIVSTIDFTDTVNGETLELNKDYKMVSANFEDANVSIHPIAVDVVLQLLNTEKANNYKIAADKISKGAAFINRAKLEGCNSYEYTLYLGDTSLHKIDVTKFGAPAGSQISWDGTTFIYSSDSFRKNRDKTFEKLGFLKEPNSTVVTDMSLQLKEGLTKDDAGWLIAPVGIYSPDGNYEILNSSSAGWDTNPEIIKIKINVVDKITPDVKASDINVTYSGKEITSSDIKGTATVNGANISGSWSFKDKNLKLVNVADSNVYDAVFTPDDLTKYNTADTTVAVNINALEITKDNTAVVLGDELTYSGTEQEQTIKSVTANNLPVTYTLLGNKAKDAGKYTLTISANGNFKGEVECGFNVKKAELTVKAETLPRPYGVENPPAKITYTGFKNKDTESVLGGTLEISYGGIGADTKAGKYEGAITLSGLESNNYDIKYIFGDIIISGTAVKMSVGKAVKRYITIVFDKEIPGLAKSNFTVKDGENTVDFTNAAAVDNTTYILEGTFEADKTYTVTANLTGSAADGEYVLENNTVSAVIARTNGGKAPSISGKVFTYTVKFETNGANKIADVKVNKNETLQKPDKPQKDGYVFDGWYSDRQLKQKYDFSQKVTKNFTLYAAWTKKEIEPDEPDNPVNPPKDDKWVSPYYDVSKSDWFYEAVEYAVKNKLMNGISDTAFDPDGNVTRAMLVTVLWRAEDKPYVNYVMPFGDVNANEYYAEAVRWAASTGIVNGVSEGAFEPETNITREQFAAILFRYAQHKKYNVSVWESTNILSYTDAGSVSEYAIPAMQYVVGARLMNGKTVSTLNPQDNATRAEIAAIMQRLEWYK